jgi:hypothetical protein
MTEPRNKEHLMQAHPQRTHHGVTSAKDGAGPAAAGRTAYREEFQRNYGPDFDEPLDTAESGHEF